MEFNRNQYFMAGLIVLLLGIQLRVVDTFVLNERATQFLAEKMKKIKPTQVASTNESPSLLGATPPPFAKHRLRLPKWLGYSVISIGGVLVLHSLALKKPGG